VKVSFHKTCDEVINLKVINGMEEGYKKFEIFSSIGYFSDYLITLHVKKDV